MKFRLTMSWEYDVNPSDFQEDYGTTDPHETLGIDIMNAQADPMLAIQSEAEDGTWIDVRGEVVE